MGDVYPALQIVPETTRKYEYSNHFSGYVGRINQSEYAAQKDKIIAFSMIGKQDWKAIRKRSTGKTGTELMHVDAMGRKLHFSCVMIPLLPKWFRF